MYFKGLHVVAPCLLGGFPSGEAAQRADVIDAELYVFLVKCGNIGFESSAYLELRHQVFPNIQDRVHIVHYNQVHNGSARSHQLAAFREDSGYLSVFGSYELGVHQKGGYFIDSAAGSVYKAAGCLLYTSPSPRDS